MDKRFVTIWFRHLKTDWFSRRQPNLINAPFVLSLRDHNRVIVSAANTAAEKQGISIGMAVADAKAIFPSLIILDDKHELEVKLLTSFAKYCIRYTPIAAIDPPNCLVLDVTGCPHLWGSELAYIDNIINRFTKFGYDVKAAMADTIGSAWATTHFDQELVIEKKQHQYSLLRLPVASLRLQQETLELLCNLGLHHIQSIIHMPRKALHRRFGSHLIQRLDQALGYIEETIHPVEIPEPFHERLPCLELISTATGIEIALQKLLDNLCLRLQQEQKGLRTAIFKCYRVDGKIEKIEIGTNRPSHNSKHLFELFQLKVDTIEPALGIELFTLDGSNVEGLKPIQKKLWAGNYGLENIKFSELLDHIENKIGPDKIHRFLPAEHYWPERSVKAATSLNEEVTITWESDKPRPIQILPTPQIIQVTAPIPDYPPMNFRYKGKLHKVIKADGPERIESEWWMEEGLHRDYYNVEDEEGNRYWLFRLGHYSNAERPQWFIHGFFA
jgi:protein ImuB